MKSYIYLLAASVLAIFSSCDDEDPVIPNEEELITTLIYTLTPVDGGQDVVLQFKDLDGDGGNAPIISTEPLAANTSYTGSLQLLNEIEDPAEDITLEVEEEGTEHQFFFLYSAGIANNITFTYDDEDTDGNPVGIQTIVETSDASTGTLSIILRHEPQKPNNGTLSDAGGETDIQVEFDLVIQ